MDINKKNRSDLKSYFVKNSIPTESNFADLIDATLNQKDDGIVKLPGDPLSIEAAGDVAGLLKVINFYAKFQDNNPAWSLQLNPRTDPKTAATAKAGFAVVDGSGATRLFIDKASGNLGIGTLSPQAGLAVVGTANVSDGNGWANVNGKMAKGSLTVGSITASYGGGSNWSANTAGLLLETLANTEIAVHDAYTRVASFMYYEGESVNKITIGRSMDPAWGVTPVVVAGNLTVNGVITPSAGKSETNGILFPKDPSGDGDAAWLRYYARAGEAMTLELGTSNNPDDHIALMPSGGVGIGINTPGAKVDIVANTTTWGGWYEAIRLSQSAHSAITHPGGGLLFGMHSDRRFYFADTKEGQNIMILDANPAGGGQVSIGASNAPIAKLDIAQAARSGAQPAAVKGLYITGDFGPDADGVEFRHSNATQGIGFGYNTIYAAGSNADQDLQLKPKGKGVVRVLGAANISNGTGVANGSNFMSSGSLTIGATNVSYGGGKSWSTNTAGLLLETLANTEIAVHDSNNRVSSLMYYEGDAANRITIGRDMGWGITPLNIAGNITLNGSVALGGFTGADADEWPKVTWYRDTPNNWDEGLIKHASNKGFFGRTGFGIHLHASRDWSFFSTGWDPLFGIEGGTGNTKIKGMLTANNVIRFGLDEGGSGPKSISFVRDATDEGNAGKITYKGGFGGDSLNIVGAGGAPGISRKIRLYDDVEVMGGTLKTNVLRLGDKWRFSAVGDHDGNDDWLRMMKADNSGYYGGFAAGRLWTAVGALSGSDERLKKDINPLEDSLTKLSLLQGVSFKWRDLKVEGTQIGLIAQEVEAVFPELVETGPEGMMGVNYTGLIAVLIEALKEQQKQIQQLFEAVKI